MVRSKDTKAKNLVNSVNLTLNFCDYKQLQIFKIMSSHVIVTTCLVRAKE